MKTSRTATVATILGLLLTACGEAATDDPTTTATAPPTTVTTTTAATTTTSTEPPTTVPGGAVTEHPNLPSALPASAISWDAVGEGWFVVLYDSSRAFVTEEADLAPGPVVLYLVDAVGERYEVTSWSPEDRPWGLVDAAGTSAIVVGMSEDFQARRWWQVDLLSGAITLVHQATFPFMYWEQAIGLSRPDGDGLLVHTLGPGDTERLEMRTGGATETLFTQPYRDVDHTFTWMAAPDGSVIVATDAGLVVVTRDGSIRDLWAPADSTCRSARLWDDTTLLAVCFGSTAETAPLSDYGDLHTHYGRLWSIPLSGEAGTALTGLPDRPVIVVDFGHSDALTVGEHTYLQWRGDCGSAAVEVLGPSGFGTMLGISGPPDAFTHGIALLDASPERLVLHGWGSCDGSEAFIFATAHDGTFLETLVPLMGDGYGVISVLRLGE